jgi:DNA polymerase
VILSIDLETRSPVDLKKSGAYRYFEHPMTEILCAAWAIDDGHVHGWVPGQSCPPQVYDALTNKHCEIAGWNVNFERQGFNWILGPVHGWPTPHLDQFRDTAAQAAAQALPRALENVANVMRLPERKDTDGARLMMQMARPRKARKGENRTEVHWNDGDLERLLEYCKTDVEVERAVRRRLKPLSDAEMALWKFDQLINDRGITIDSDLVDDMIAIVDEESVRLNAVLKRLTNGAVEKATQTERLKAWLTLFGVQAPSLAKTVIDGVFAQDMPPECRAALEAWQEASRASVRKLQAALNCVGGDGRARGLLLFHGASTGRWSGQLLQPHNFTRGSGLVQNQDIGIDCIKTRDPRVLDWGWGHPLTVVSDCLRGIMVAGEGRELISGDYTNIESRITAWMAHDEAKLEKFRRQDDGTGEEVYRLTAASIYHKPVEDVTKAERQTGKTAELALGFGGGVDALAAMAMNYHIDMAEAFPALHDAADKKERELVDKAYRDCIAKGNNLRQLSEDAWKACRYTVRAWRRAHPATVQTWDDFHSAAWHAFDEPGTVHTAGRVSFKRDTGFIWMTLPSGRALAYPTPGVESRVVPWSDKRKPEHEQEHKDMLTVLAFEGKHRRRDAFYPGLFFQHSVQATARDLLAVGMQNVETAGYPVVMTVHDEVISEVRQGEGNLTHFMQALTMKPLWAAGLPLLADGWRGFRYRKD